jgi:hypothetical protein
MRRAPLLIGLLVLSLAPAAARAQLGPVTLDALRLRAGGGVRVHSAGAVASAADADGPLAAFAANMAWPIAGALIGFDAGVAWANDVALAGVGGVNVATAAGANRLRFRLGAGAAADAQRGPAVVEARAVVGRGGFSLSIGSSWLPSVPGLYRDTVLAVGDTTTPHRITVRAPQPRRTYADAEIGYRWRVARFELAGIVGHRFAADSMRRPWWAHVTSSVVLTPATTVGVTIGRDGGVPWLDAARRTFATLFVRHDLPLRRAQPPAPADEAIGPLRIIPGTLTELTIVVRGARSVELAGGFTEWRPLALRPVGDGAWRLALRIPPGVHHVALRIDGGPWRAPPGLPAVPDEFGGESGVFVVR